MYQLVSAVLRQKGKNHTWVNHDISLETLGTVFTKYQDGYITLTNTAIAPTPLFVDYELLKSAAVTFVNLPFENWLGTLGNIPLPHSLTEPTITSNKVRFSDASQARFSVTRIHPTFVMDPCGPNPVFTPNEMSDLLLVKPNISIEDLNDYVLCTVNGFLHRASFNEIGLQIPYGALSIDVCNDNKVGLISFKEIGKLTQLPITSNMIHRMNNFPYQHEVYIETGLDLTDKSVMVSLGGYLHVEDSVVDVISPDEGIIKLTFDKINLIRRLYEMRKYLNLDSLPFLRSDIRKDAVSVLDFHSDANLLSYLTMAQSFIIIVDAPILYTNKVLLAKPGLPGFYEHITEPISPLQSPTGRLLEYWYRLEYDRWVISVGENLFRNYLHETRGWLQEINVDDTNQRDGLDYAICHLLEITSDALTT